MANRITARIAAALANLRGALAPGASAPLPGRYRSGQYPDWASMLATFAKQYEPIHPSEAREGTDSSLVDICINWIATSWSTASPQIGKEEGDTFTPLPNQQNHWLIKLLHTPAEDMDGATLFWALLQDYIRRGNAYCHIIRTRGGEVLSLEYIPARYVKPVGDDKGRLLGYQYVPNGEVIPLERSEVLHIRHGVDENNWLAGRSPLAAQYREIVLDNRAADYAAGLAKAGLPAVFFTPRAVGDGTVAMTAEEAKYITDALSEKMAQEPGKPRVLSGALDMHKPGLSPAEMAFNDMRAMPETRIPAALGLPPLLLQLLTGIQKGTFNNFQTAVALGWTGCIIPMMHIFGSAITRQVLYLNAADKKAQNVLRWDTSSVPELDEHLFRVREAAREDVKVGVLTEDEARALQGLAPLPEPVTPPAPALPAADQSAKRLAADLLRTVKVSQAGGSIYAVADAYRRQLARDEQAALDALAEAWAETMAATEKRLAELTAAMQDEDTTDARLTATAARLADLLPQMEEQLAALAERGATITAEGQAAMIAATQVSTARMATAQGISSWNKLPDSAFESAVGLASDKSPLVKLYQDAFADYAADVRTKILTGIAQGQNPRQTAALISGINGTSRARAESICRTEMLRASREACRQTYQANRDVLSGWTRLSAADGRTCTACWALHGSQHTTDDIMASHTNCRCVMVPNPRPIEGVQMGEDIPLGDELFAQLDEAMQLEILGPGRFELYQQGNTLASFVEVQTDPRWGPTVSVRPLATTLPEGNQ